MLVQDPFFTADYLSSLAMELDDRERAVHAVPLERFRSQNFDDSGYFSIQVSAG